MVNKKYANDYHLENTKTKRGKIKTVAVYGGPQYTFKAAADTVRRTGRLCALLTALCVLFFAAVLFLNTAVLRQMYVLFPFLCCALPLGYQSVAVLYTLTTKPPFTRERNDKMHDRLAKTSLFLMVFSAISMAGAAVAYLLKIALPDWQGFFFLAATAVLFLCAGTIYRQKAAFVAATT